MLKNQQKDLVVPSHHAVHLWICPLHPTEWWFMELFETEFVSKAWPVACTGRGNLDYPQLEMKFLWRLGLCFWWTGKAFGRVSNLGIWWNSLSWRSHIPNLNQFDSLDALAFYRRGWKLKPSNLECSVPRAGRDTVNKKSKHGSLEWIDIYRIEIRLVLISPCQRARSACDNLWLASPTWWSCWCMFFNRIIYLSPKNHVSVKNGCISNRSVTFQIFRPIFHWNHDISWFMGERVVSSYTRVKVNGTLTRLTMHYSIGLY